MFRGFYFLVLFLSSICLNAQTDIIYNNLKEAYIFSEQAAINLIEANRWIERMQKETFSVDEYKQNIQKVRKIIYKAGKNLSLAADKSLSAKDESENIRCDCIENNSMICISGFYSAISNFSEADKSFQQAIEASQSENILKNVSKGKASLEVSIYQMKEAVKRLRNSFDDLNYCVVP